MSSKIIINKILVDFRHHFCIYEVNICRGEFCTHIISSTPSIQDKDQRSMDIETARAMLQLLLGRHWPLYPEFAQFLDQSKYKVINKDQWCNILEFSRTITNDLSNYDIDGACEYCSLWLCIPEFVLNQLVTLQIKGR